VTKEVGQLLSTLGTAHTHAHTGQIQAAPFEEKVSGVQCTATRPWPGVVIGGDGARYKVNHRCRFENGHGGKHECSCSRRPKPQAPGGLTAEVTWQ
jgi:hypothetical protein